MIYLTNKDSLLLRRKKIVDLLTPKLNKNNYLNHNQQIQIVKAMVIKYPNPNYYKRNEKERKKKSST
jgi:hypothetical protein